MDIAFATTADLPAMADLLADLFTLEADFSYGRAYALNLLRKLAFTATLS